MKTLIYGVVLMIFGLLLTGCEEGGDYNEDSGSIIINKGNPGGFASTLLIDGNNEIIGEVNVSVSGNHIVVNYIITIEGWLLSETNLAIENSPEDIPQTVTGNPKPKEFKYSTIHHPSVKEYSYIVPKGGFTTVYIAAHAYVLNPISENCSGLAEREALIPGTAVRVVNTLLTGGPGFYKVDLSDAGEIDGAYTGWCADNNQKDADFKTAHLVSSYSKTTDLSQIVPVPSNLPHLNYMLNKYHTKYSQSVIQAAVWRLMNGKFNNPSGGIELTSDQNKQYNTVISDALANGSGFIPGTSDYLVILVDSGDKINYQNVLFILKKCVPVYSIEISWGDGQKFSGNSLAKYFGYRIQ